MVEGWTSPVPAVSKLLPGETSSSVQTERLKKVADVMDRGESQLQPDRTCRLEGPDMAC